jgi:hypothetical protein
MNVRCLGMLDCPVKPGNDKEFVDARHFGRA